MNISVELNLTLFSQSGYMYLSMWWEPQARHKLPSFFWPKLVDLVNVHNLLFLVVGRTYLLAQEYIIYPGYKEQCGLWLDDFNYDCLSWAQPYCMMILVSWHFILTLCSLNSRHVSFQYCTCPQLQFVLLISYEIKSPPKKGSNLIWRNLICPIKLVGQALNKWLSLFYLSYHLPQFQFYLLLLSSFSIWVSRYSAISLFACCSPAAYCPQ